MKPFLTLLLGLCAILSLQAQTLNGSESIEFDRFHNRYLISNTGSGQIIARDMQGNLSVFASNISPAPYGLEILGNTVYAACGGTVKGFDLETGVQVFNLNLGASFLNGITTDGLFNLFVTDFSAKTLYRVNPSSNAFNLKAQNLGQSPNGIAYDQANSRLVFVNWGSNAPIKAFNLSDSTVTTIATTTLGNCDGICYNGLDSWYITAWTGSKLVKMDRDFSQAPLTLLTGLSSPADIDYNLRGDSVCIANSGNNTLRFLGMPSLNRVDCALLPLEVLDNSASFSASTFLGDSVLRISMKNVSGLGFAYPLARVTPVSTLPDGMSYAAGQTEFNVFASAWNPDSTVTAEFFYSVAQAIPVNTILEFQLDITNLDPSSADTCFFTDTFSVNLNPDVTVGMEDANLMLSAWPNPFQDVLRIPIEQTHTSVYLTDLQGRLQAVPQVEENGIRVLQTESLPAGMYMLHWAHDRHSAIRVVKLP
jgi:DNA-binding beta-propeller fold protein YncE